MVHLKQQGSFDEIKMIRMTKLYVFIYLFLKKAVLDSKALSFLLQIFVPILQGLALAVKECSFDSDNFKYPLMVREVWLNVLSSMWPCGSLS